MLDVIHAYFEEDFVPRWEQDVEIKSRVRESINRTLFGSEYAWKIDPSGPTAPPPDADYTGDVGMGVKPRQRASSGLQLTAVNPETGTMELPEGTKRADPAKRLPRVQSATSVEDLEGILGTPLG